MNEMEKETERALRSVVDTLNAHIAIEIKNMVNKYNHKFVNEFLIDLNSNLSISIILSILRNVQQDHQESFVKAFFDDVLEKLKQMNSITKH